MRVPRWVESQVIAEYLVDLDAYEAGRRVGIMVNPAHYVNAVLKRPRVAKMLAAEIEARRMRAQIDADYVLQELVRELGKLRIQLGKLEAMRDRDIAELYDEKTNELLPVHAWSPAWRRGLIVEIVSQEQSARSHDGETKDKDGGWDRAGTLKRVARMPALDIEREIRWLRKEIRATLLEIGRHTQVNAFPVPGKEIGEGLEAVAAAIDGAIAAGRMRAARAPELLEPEREPERERLTETPVRVEDGAGGLGHEQHSGLRGRVPEDGAADFPEPAADHHN